MIEYHYHPEHDAWRWLVLSDDGKRQAEGMAHEIADAIDQARDAARLTDRRVVQQ